MVVIMYLLGIGLSALIICSMCMVFKKMGKPWWGALIPLYNSYLMFEYALDNGWKMFLTLIPIYNIYIMFKVWMTIAEKLGKSSGFGVGCALLPIIFIPMLAFSKDDVQVVVADDE